MSKPVNHPSSTRHANLVPALTAALFVLALAMTGCQPQAGADFPTTPFVPAFAALPKLSGEPPLSLSLLPAQTAPAPAAPADQVRMWTDWDGDRSLPGYLRSKHAHEARLPVVQQLFAKAGVPFPPAQMAFTAYKAEDQLEVWAAAEKGGRAVKIATYAICAASGDLGPKRYEGDHQVPEGHYALQYGWAESAFHFEMKVSYPNMVDKVLGPKNRPLGGEIMIHGSCASIGCLAMGDERVEELWVMMKAMGDAQVKVQIYPSRDMDSLLANQEYARHHDFWRNLKQGRDIFEREHRFVPVKADWHGVYMYE